MKLLVLVDDDNSHQCCLPWYHDYWHSFHSAADHERRVTVINVFPGITITGTRFIVQPTTNGELQSSMFSLVSRLLALVSYCSRPPSASYSHQCFPWYHDYWHSSHSAADHERRVTVINVFPGITITGTRFIVQPTTNGKLQSSMFSLVSRLLALVS